MLQVQEADDSPPITSGTVMVQPRYVHTLPLLRDDELLGVLELSGFTPLNKIQDEYLEGAIAVVTPFIFMALQRDRIATLLRQTEESAKKAEEQSRVLQENNARMEEQQQQLQQQTEELQQTNAQMEEQQQQLQQQTEELQQTNAQMEEQRQQVELQSAELRRNNEALRRSQEELNSRARQLEEANRYKSDFLANMSHELRTPLNAINVISKMMIKNEHGNLDAETIKRAQMVHGAGNDLLRMISDILDLSKIEAGRIEMHIETFSSIEIADEMQALFKESAAEKNIAYDVDDVFQGNIVSDRHKLVQVLRNLLSNAFKFTNEGRVSLKIQPSGDIKRPLQIMVADTGIGIPAQELANIFDEFRQVDGSISRQYGGTGLGLAISKKFVALLDGTIAVKSTEARGSEFKIMLPVRLEASHSEQSPPKPKAKPRKQPSKPAAKPAADVVARSGKRILVIDDNPHFLENISLINGQKGLDTLTAMNGKDGIEIATTSQPDGIILDLGLPDMSGEEVLEQLKTDADLKHIPVYIISASDKKNAILDKGAIGYLQKPVSDSQIETVEKTLLNFSPMGDKSILLVEGPTINGVQLERSIGRDEGQLTTARSGEAALELAAKESFDLVLTDHDVIDMDCAELCEKLHDRHPDLPIIIYGSHGLDEERLSRLRKFTDSIIQQAPQAGQRIMRDIERFLHDTLTATRDDPVKTDNGSTQPLAGKRILVVDDDPRNLYVLTASLEQNGAEVLQALNGKKALNLLAKEYVDLVFMDIMMPEMNGYDAMQAIRADANLKELPIIALTAKALKEDRNKCLDAGADDYLSKPVDYEVLVNMARAWIEKKV